MFLDKRVRSSMARTAIIQHNSEIKNVSLVRENENNSVQQQQQQQRQRLRKIKISKQ